MFIRTRRPAPPEGAGGGPVGVADFLYLAGVVVPAPVSPALLAGAFEPDEEISLVVVVVVDPSGVLTVSLSSTFVVSLQPTSPKPVTAPRTSADARNRFITLVSFVVSN